MRSVGITLAEVGGTNPARGAYKYYAHDNIQSTRGLFEQNKAVAGTIEYTPYGENYTSPAPTGLSHRFTGLDLDATTGQYYAPYRYYAPNLSRWLTRDPLGMVDGTNIFLYVALHPTRLTDPLGLFYIFFACFGEDVEECEADCRSIRTVVQYCIVVEKIIAFVLVAKLRICKCGQPGAIPKPNSC